MASIVTQREAATPAVEGLPGAEPARPADRPGAAGFAEPPSMVRRWR
jgi:hypothetical protein